MLAVIGLIQEIITLAPVLVKTGADLAGLWGKVDEVMSANRVVGDADWDALDAQIAALKADLAKDPGQ